MVRLRRARRVLARVLSLTPTAELTCHLMDGYVVWTDDRGVTAVVRRGVNDEESK